MFERVCPALFSVLFGFFWLLMAAVVWLSSRRQDGTFFCSIMGLFFISVGALVFIFMRWKERAAQESLV